MIKGRIGRVVFDLVDVSITSDRHTYAKWSARAKLRMLAALSAKGRDYNIHPKRWDLTAFDAPQSARYWLAARRRHAILRAKKERRFVSRAVPSPFVRAFRSEMRQLIADFSKPWPRRLSIIERARAAWRAWNVRYQ